MFVWGLEREFIWLVVSFGTHTGLDWAGVLSQVLPPMTKGPCLFHRLPHTHLHTLRYPQITMHLENY